MNLQKNKRLADLEAKVERLEKFMPVVEGCLVTLSEWLYVNQQFVIKLQSKAKQIDESKKEEPKTEESKPEQQPNGPVSA